MRTNLYLLAGLLLLTAAYILGKLLSEPFPSAKSWTTVVFIVAWLALSAINLLGGVTRAGYSMREELPIFLLIFSLPALGMLVVRWKLL